jgi:ubiquinone/menaquinone biosynthesis C-methylase UbiE
VNDGPTRQRPYEFAGIDDLAEFYRQRYASGEILDADYFDAVNRFDIRWARTMLVYDNVRRGSSVLDIGCGAGVLALLKRKEVILAGIDISSDCAAIARRNGYDLTANAELTALPFADASFDYVVSLDVMGHVEFDQKDAVLAEVKRVLRPDGVTLHGVECMNRDRQKDYSQMTEEELLRFVRVDGHVGMEDETANATRFRRFFKYVRTEPRFSVCGYCDELIKQADDYGLPPCEEDFLDYLRGLSPGERRAFNMAMGYVFDRISSYGIKMPASGYLLVKASDKPLGDFYNEHRDRGDLFPGAIDADMNNPVCLDRSSRASFNSGWYAAENLPPIARWMGRVGHIRFRANSLSELGFYLACHLPDLAQHPLNLEFFLNGQAVGSQCLTQSGWTKVELKVSKMRAQSPAGAPHDFVFQIRADRTWQPCSTDPASSDNRELSVAICNIEITQ